MGVNLFADVDDDHSDIVSKIEINEEFARRYEHNKRREDMQRLEDLKKKGLAGKSDSNDDDDSESESSPDTDDADEEDLQFFDALIKVKNQDPSLKQQDTILFDEKESGETKYVKGEKSKKAMYLKDVMAKQLIEEGAEYDDEEEVEEPKPKSYADEQEELRKAFLDAADVAMEEDGGELLSVKENAAEYDDESGDVEMQKKLDEYFGEDGNLDENSMFLKEYFLNKMWIGDGDTRGGAGDEEAERVSEDEEEIEKQEEYEKNYNFRYEENAGDRVLGHSRIVEGSVRKKSNARKAQRESKKERMARAEEERKEELKRLKNLKKREILEKMNKIKEIAGIGENGVLPMNEDDLDGEFDPEEYDRKMKEAFDDDYYNADDAEPGFGSDSDDDGRPDFDKEDELLGLPKNWDVCVSGDGFLAAREKILKQKKDIETDSEKEEMEPEEGGKLKRKHRDKDELTKEWKKMYLEETSKLEYEDTIGDLKTRFKYTTVNSKRFGLSAEEILMMDDKDLNQYVSLKKLAPYREKEWKVPNNRRYEQKMKNKLLLEEAKLNRKKNSGRKKWKVNQKGSNLEKDAKQDESAQVEVSNGDMGNVSRSSRRRRRQEKLKLSRSRLMAYGKVPTKPKSKAKH